MRGFAHAPARERRRASAAAFRRSLRLVTNRAASISDLCVDRCTTRKSGRHQHRRGPLRAGEARENFLMADVVDESRRVHGLLVDRTRHHRGGVAARGDAGGLSRPRAPRRCRTRPTPRRTGMPRDAARRHRRTARRATATPAAARAGIERPARADHQRPAQPFERAARERFREHFRADTRRIARADRDDGSVSGHRIAPPISVYSYSMVTLVDLVADFELYAVCIRLPAHGADRSAPN